MDVNKATITNALLKFVTVVAVVADVAYVAVVFAIKRGEFLSSLHLTRSGCRYVRVPILSIS
jgi:hypothetical protein